MQPKTYNTYYITYNIQGINRLLRIMYNVWSATSNLNRITYDLLRKTYNE